MNIVDQYASFMDEEIQAIKTWFRDHDTHLDDTFVTEGYGLMDSGTLVDFELIDDISDLHRYVNQCRAGLIKTQDYFGITDETGFNIILKMNHKGTITFRSFQGIDTFADFIFLADALEHYRLD
jgi:formylmethanofuran dehydrogenase subunit C